jgi:hypothetical protein
LRGAKEQSCSVTEPHRLDELRQESQHEDDRVGIAEVGDQAVPHRSHRRATVPRRLTATDFISARQHQPCAKPDQIDSTAAPQQLEREAGGG